MLSVQGGVPLTGPETLAKVLEEHTVCDPSGMAHEFCHAHRRLGNHCERCEQPFPCLTRRLAETVREQNEALSKIANNWSPSCSYECAEIAAGALKLERLVTT